MKGTPQQVEDTVENQGFDMETQTIHLLNLAFLYLLA